MEYEYYSEYNDDYAPTEEITKRSKPGHFMNMRDFGLDAKKDLVYLEEISTMEAEEAINKILSSKIVGFDSELTPCFYKYQTAKLVLLQIATAEKVFVFNVMKMKEKPHFEKYQNFVKDLLADPEIIKVGHSIDKDLNMIIGTQNRGIKSTIDIAKIYKAFYPAQRKSALAFICEDLFGKPLSKYEQVSDWGNPALRKAQIFYAGMDALVPLGLFGRLKEEIEMSGKDFNEFVRVGGR